MRTVQSFSDGSVVKSNPIPDQNSLYPPEQTSVDIPFDLDKPASDPYIEDEVIDVVGVDVDPETLQDQEILDPIQPSQPEDYSQSEEFISQTEIFNLLTQQGSSQGTFYYGTGQDQEQHLYINSTYVRSGVIQVGGLSNNLGVFMVLDENNNIIGQWDKQGIALKDGIIQSFDNSSWWNLKTGTLSLNGYVTAYKVEYAVGDSRTTAPSSGWSQTVPTQVPDGQYIWQRSTLKRTGEADRVTTVCIQGKNGTNGTNGRGIRSAVVEYYLSTSAVERTGGSWSAAAPAYESGKYYWTRTKITYTDNAIEYSDPVLDLALTQANRIALDAHAISEIAQDAADQAKADAADAKEAADQAVADAGTAKTAAQQAVSDAADAKTAAQQAQSDANAAAASASSAQTSASNAATSASAAQTSASNAATAASNAQTSASNAETSASNAASSASDAAADAATANQNAASAVEDARTAKQNAAAAVADAATAKANAATAIADAATAQSAAQTAQSAAETADQKAAAAGNAASAAQSSADSAAASASTANSNALQAIQDAAAAQQAADDAQDSADAAATAAGVADGKAVEAKNAADAAQTSADNAQDSADEAAAAARTADGKAVAAATAAQAAQSSADQALSSASTANKAANGALEQLSVVEDVVDVLSWVQEHGTYTASTDTTVVPGKYYFTRSGSAPNYSYSFVTNPTGNPSTNNYYECTGVDEAITNYVTTHLALTNDGLYIVMDNLGYKLKLAADGAYVIDPTGTTVAKYGENITFDSNRPQRIGNNNVYIEYYDSNNDSVADALRIVGAAITLSSGKTVEQSIGAVQSDLNNYKTTNNAAVQGNATDLANYITSNNAALQQLQTQIDGAIETWFYEVDPTLSNTPAKDWTQDEKNIHLGDLYYNTATGHVFRWQLVGSTYSWTQIQDIDATKALADAAAAQATANNKRRVFVTTPAPPYDIGDLWVQGSTGDIMRCATAKTSSQSYAQGDWVKASKYTDDTKANAVASDLNAYKTTVSNTYVTNTTFETRADAIEGQVTSVETTTKSYADGLISQEVIDRNAAINAKANEINLAVSQVQTNLDNYINPIITKEYKNVVISANNDPNGYLYFGSIKPENYFTPWRVKYKVYSIIDSIEDSAQYSEVLLEGSKNTWRSYQTYNVVGNTDRKPIYAHMLYTLKDTGVDNGYGHLLGLRFQSAYWPAVSADYKRTVKIEVIEAENCTPSLLDSMVLYSEAPGTGSTNYYGRYSFDGTTQGYTQSGDRNETNTLVNNFYGKTGAIGFWAYSLVMRDGVGTYQGICTASDGTVTAGNRTTDTTKKANPNGFEVGSSIYLFPWNTVVTNTSFNLGAYASYGAFDSRYSINSTLTANFLTVAKPIYLVGTVNTADGLFYLDPVWWTQNPTTNNKVYVLIGTVYDSSTSYCRFNLFEQNRWYICVNGQLVDYSTAYTNAQIKVTSDSINLEVSKKVGADEIISKINQTAESVTIDASKININGVITAGNIAKTADIPTKTSDLTNDSNLAYVSDIPTKVGDLTNDKGYQTASDVTTTLSPYAKSSDISNTYATKSTAIYREQRIYITKASGTNSVSANTTWVTSVSDSQNAWTTKRPTYNSSYPVLFTAIQAQTVTQSAGTTCSCTTPIKDDTLTVIDGGHIITGSIDANKIAANSITTNELASDAIKSTNYQASSNSSSPYSATGTFLDLTTGNLYMPNFGVDNVYGKAYLNGEIVATGGRLGVEGSQNYWEIDTTKTDYNANNFASIVGHGNAFIQVGQFQLSDNLLDTRSYDAQAKITYPKYDNTYWDFGVQAPTLDTATSGYVQGVDDNFLYIRNHASTIPSLKTDWNYLFRVDKSGNIYTTGQVYVNGTSLDDRYALKTDVGSTYLPTAGGTITGNLTVNGSINGTATSATQLTHTLSINGKTWSGSANLDVSTIGVGYGGTGATSFTSGAALIGNGSGAIQTRAITNNGSATYISGSTNLITANTLKYFNGAYDSSHNSNIEYVKQGLLGDVVTHDIDEFITVNGGIIDGSLQVTDLTAGNLVVTGVGRFTNGLYGDLTGNASTADKVNHDLVIQLNGGTTEGTNKFTFNGSAAKTVNVTPSSIGLGNVNNTADSAKNVLTATKFSSARTIALTGDVTGSASADGSSGWSIATTVKDDSHNHTWNTILPIQSKTYTGVLGTANNWTDTTFFYGKIVPSDFTSAWRIKYRIHTYVPGKDGYDMKADVMISGYKDVIASYSSMNTVAQYYPAYYHVVYRGTQAGITNGYGHALGVRLQSSYNPISTGYERTIVIELIEVINCTFTFFDNVMKYTAIPGTGSTNYVGYTEINYVSNGLQETGDSNTVDNGSIYFSAKTGEKGIWAGSLFMQTGDGKYEGICTASDGTITNNNRTVATTKKANTTGFKVGGKIYYSTTNYNANTNISGWLVVYTTYSTFDSRYAINSELTNNFLTPYAPIYLVGTISNDGLFYLDSTWWTQTPNEENKVYVLIGGVYDSTTSYCRITLYEHNPWYIYDGSKLVEYVSKAIVADSATKLATTRSFTVGKTAKNVDWSSAVSFSKTEISDNASGSAAGWMSSAHYTKLEGIEAGAQVNTITGVKGNSESSYRTGNVNITAANIGLGNLTNDKQVKGLASGTTAGHFVTWGANGYTVADSGYTAGQVVKTLASNNDGKIILTYLDGTTSDPIEVKIIGSSGSSVSYADALNVNGAAVGSATQPVFINAQGKPQTANSIPKLNNGTTGGTFYAPTAAGTSGQYLKSSGSGAPTWETFSKSTVGLNNVANIDQSKAIKSITKSGSTYTMTALDNTTSTFSSHITGIKGNEETNYRSGNVNLTPQNIGAIPYNETLFTTNVFAPAEKRRLYISKIDNAFYALDKRYSVTVTYDGQNISNVAQFFDGDYEGHSLHIENNKTAVFTIDFSSGSGSKFSGYPYGYIYISFYNRNIPKTITGRVYNNYESQGTGWHDLTFEQYADSIYRTRQPYYGLQTLEITMVGSSDTPYGYTGPNEIEMHLDRPESYAHNPIVTKYCEQELYYNITAPKFIGALQGNADTATKATQDASGNTITSTYAKLSGATFTGAVNFANNTWNLIGDDVYIGDMNQAGKIGIKGKNGATGIVFVPYSGSTNNTISVDGAGNLTITGTTIGTFSGNLSGNATTATSATKATQDGSGNVITSTYVKKAGDTMTGNLLGNGTATLGTTAAPFHQLVLGGSTSATMTAASANPRITFCEGTGTQPVHLIYSDYDNYRSPAGLKIIGDSGASSSPAWLEVEGTVYAPTFSGSLSGNATSATKATQDDEGYVIKDTYAKKASPTFTGSVTSPYYLATTKMTVSAGKVYGSVTTSLPRGGLFADGIAFNSPGTYYDAGWIRILGTGESDTVFEIATGDDGGQTNGNAETIVARQYNTSNVIKKELTILDKLGNTEIPGTLTIAEGVTLTWNSSTSSLDFSFAS